LLITRNNRGLAPRGYSRSCSSSTPFPIPRLVALEDAVQNLDQRKTELRREIDNLNKRLDVLMEKRLRAPMALEQTHGENQRERFDATQQPHR